MDASPESALKLGVFEGQAAFHAALRQALLHACAQGARDIFWLDGSLVDWPLSDEACLAALTDWARRPRCLHLLALDYEDLRRRHPRFVRWRTLWGHCVQARAYEADAPGPGGLAAAFVAMGGEQAVSVRLFDAQTWRGAVSLQTADAARTREWIDALAQRSCESFAATTLGL